MMALCLSSLEEGVRTTTISNNLNQRRPDRTTAVVPLSTPPFPQGWQARPNSCFTRSRTGMTSADLASLSLSFSVLKVVLRVTRSVVDRPDLMRSVLLASSRGRTQI